jgi:hypothetical protein
MPRHWPRRTIGDNEIRLHRRLWPRLREGPLQFLLGIGILGSTGDSAMMLPDEQLAERCQPNSFEEAVQSIMEDLECTWLEAEAVYFDRQTDESDLAYERERELGL